ncbi:MAG: hypothetical protein GXP56_06725 [Deltaproteobacteria bacterium]|nr:hypothetical protein [Deltaproteobacteria bacterium]
MNPQWFGDSYDIVKRFFIEQLNAAGYQVLVDPMLTGEWNELKTDFYRFLKASPLTEKSTRKSALLLDPDIGIGKKKTKQHITIGDIADHLLRHEVVFSFDQSFSRVGNATEKIQEKLMLLKKTGNYGFYYDSHARFLFAAKSSEILYEVEQQILSSGLPSKRIVKI